MSFSSSAKKRFDCSTCDQKTAERRRCKSDRFNFTGEDEVTVFPIVIDEGGTFFGFCPGKANWYPDVVALFKTLVVCCELNQLPYSGAIMDQPASIIEKISWFAPIYKSLATAHRHGLVSKDQSAVKGVPEYGDNNGRSPVSNHSRFKRRNQRH